MKKPKYIKFTQLDIKAGIGIMIDIKKSEPACMICLPPKAIKDHKYLSGSMVHERIDCPENVLYFTNIEL